MYQFLSRAIKKRLIEELRFCFDSNPRHRDIVKNIQEKYTFKERPQKGIILESANASPQKLSANNFLGTLHSHVMQAHVDDYGGTSLEWVREDDKAIRDNGGYFPSEPGVYYIEIEEITLPSNTPDYQFWVDPLLSVYEEEIFEFQGGEGVGTQATLTYAPVLDGAVDLYAYPSFPLLRGTAIRLRADETLYIGNDAFSLGFGPGYVPVAVTSDFGGPYFIDSVNNTLAFEMNGVDVVVTLPEGNLVSASSIVSAIDYALKGSGLAPTEYEVSEVSGGIRLVATRSLRFEADNISTANVTLGFFEGHVGVDATGTIIQGYVPPNSTFRAIVDGNEVSVPLSPGNTSVFNIAQEVSDAFVSTSLEVSAVEGGDYILDAQDGTVTFLTEFEKGTRIIADYRYPIATRGPYPIGNGEVSNNIAIPGVTLAFGNQVEHGDIMAVVVGPDRDEVADVYGGKINMSLDFTIMARDSMTRNDLADLTLMYLWQWRRELLAEDGIFLEDVSFGGESEEPYDDVGDDYYYLASISVSLMTDWELYIEKPLFIRRVSTRSFDQEARRAATANGILLESPDNVLPVPENRLKEFSRIYIMGRAGSYERVR